MVSGTLVNRRYVQVETNYACEANRSDPWHYPNYMEVRDSEHYKNHQRRNCHCDPHFWTIDPKLRDAVSEEQVQMHVRSASGMPAPGASDPNIMAILFSDEIRPQKETLKELNVDLSCVDLPQREGGPGPLGSTARSTKGFGSPKAQPSPKADIGYQSRWKWCTSGREIPNFKTEMSEEESTMLRSQSLPQMLPGSSLLVGAEGMEQRPFHGMATRRFGGRNWDGRMRGGKLARTGWAGTFPEKEARLK
eukprot:TRINITY_DN10260_c0_g1_i1.p1 TRINITY_DN10260_c0_g1~~TRINITY_DN10260_c0_g1_i1.p1  ORF type:complete len:249 (+),score=42.16 TRINITY_DN10260_c0_g1_i1:141-887(+)